MGNEPGAPVRAGLGHPDLHALNPPIGSLVALLGLHAVGNPAHIDLRGRGALAGMKTFRVEDNKKLAVDIDDIALAELAGDDLHVNDP